MPVNCVATLSLTFLDHKDSGLSSDDSDLFEHKSITVVTFDSGRRRSDWSFACQLLISAFADADRISMNSAERLVTDGRPKEFPVTIFTKIIEGEIPADIVYEDDLCLAFRDVNPQAPTHVLLIPRKPIVSLDDLSEEDSALAGHLMLKVPLIAEQLGLTNGYRTVVNTGEEGGQSVFHLHIHILGGRNLQWPPG